MCFFSFTMMYKTRVGRSNRFEWLTGKTCDNISHLNGTRPFSISKRINFFTNKTTITLISLNADAVSSFRTIKRTRSVGIGLFLFFFSVPQQNSVGHFQKKKKKSYFVHTGYRLSTQLPYNPFFLEKPSALSLARAWIYLYMNTVNISLA